MAIYRTNYTNPLKSFSLADRLNGQIVLSGTDQSYSVSDGIFFLETLVIESGSTVTIKDGSGNTIVSGLTSITEAITPLKCEKGISFTGDVVYAKGFIVENILQ